MLFPGQAGGIFFPRVHNQCRGFLNEARERA
jgi:hypothetical protein